MTSFPNSPRLSRAALLAVRPDSSTVVGRVALQYNPDQLTRSLQIEGEPRRAGLPPGETLRVEAELDATDALEQGRAGDTVAARLAALEALIYPTSRELADARQLAARGTLEILAPEPPRLLFVWGGRSVPVVITEYSAVEEAFGPDLTPIRAKVTLGMRVRTDDDQFTSYHRSRELLARKADRTP